MTYLDYGVLILAGMAAIVTLGGIAAMKLSHDHRETEKHRIYR